MARLLRIPKMQMLFALSAIIITAIIHKPTLQVVIIYLASILLTIGWDYFFLKVRRVDFFLPSAALVTGSIIGLLHSPLLPIYELFVVTFLAMFSKHFIKKGRKHLFNPAAFGLFLTGIIFFHTVSWWAASFQEFKIQNVEFIIFFLILLLPGYISVIKLRRYWIIFPFLIIYSLLNYVLNHFFSLFDPTVLFFALVMLPEPMTTPNKSKVQIAFGIFVALVSLLLASPILTTRLLFLNSLPDPLVTGLLMGNLIFLPWK